MIKPADLFNYLLTQFLAVADLEEGSMRHYLLIGPIDILSYLSFTTAPIAAIDHRYNRKLVPSAKLP